MEKKQGWKTNKTSRTSYAAETKPLMKKGGGVGKATARPYVQYEYFNTPDMDGGFYVVALGDKVVWLANDVDAIEEWCKEEEYRIGSRDGIYNTKKPKGAKEWDVERFETLDSNGYGEDESPYSGYVLFRKGVPHYVGFSEDEFEDIISGNYAKGGGVESKKMSKKDLERYKHYLSREEELSNAYDEAESEYGEDSEDAKDAWEDLGSHSKSMRTFEKDMIKQYGKDFYKQYDSYVDGKMKTGGSVKKISKALHERVRKLLGDISVNNHKGKILVQEKIDSFYDNFNKDKDYNKALDFILTYEANDRGKTINQNSIKSIENELHKAGIKMMKEGGSVGGGLESKKIEIYGFEYFLNIKDSNEFEFKGEDGVFAKGNIVSKGFHVTSMKRFDTVIALQNMIISLGEKDKDENYTLKTKNDYIHLTIDEGKGNKDGRQDIHYGDKLVATNNWSDGETLQKGTMDKDLAITVIYDIMDSKINSSNDDDDFPMTLQYNVEYFTKDGGHHYEEMALTEASEEAALTVLQDYRGLDVKEIVSIVRAEEDWDKSHSKGKEVGSVNSNINMSWSSTKKITEDIRNFIFDSYEEAGQQLAADVIEAIEKGIEFAKIDIGI